ncbi:MAG: MBOAT family O-acyltransferase [Hyphomicrobiaceae bacterium]
MVFASVEFLFVLLPLTLLAYYLVGYVTGRVSLLNVVMLIASLVFYDWSGGVYTIVLLAVILINYVAGLAIHRFDGRSKGAQKLALVVGVAANLGVLAYFKYAGFVVAQLAFLPSWVPKADPAAFQIILPIGISFYIFQAMSYLIDVYRHDARYQPNLANFALYVVMFPQLIAGPIVRYQLVAEQIDERKPLPGVAMFADGVTRFAIGFAKKVIVADTMAVVVDAVYAAPPSELSAPVAWLGLLAYTFQIYFDFSGYSDMAIGLGLMFGLKFPENFNRPYASVSITDFWRRWHMTLSSWFRDYLYIPLGGSRGSAVRTYVNLIIVFMATGIWHGANWTFIVWGAYHGAWLIVERVLGVKLVEDGRSHAVRRLLTFFIVVLGWNLFRAPSLEHAGQMYYALFAGGFGPAPAAVADVLTNYFYFMFMLAAGLIAASQFVSLRAILMEPSRLGDWARVGLVAGAFPYAVMMVASGTFSAFIYYQF